MGCIVLGQPMPRTWANRATDDAPAFDTQSCFAVRNPVLHLLYIRRWHTLLQFGYEMVCNVLQLGRIDGKELLQSSDLFNKIPGHIHHRPCRATSLAVSR